MADKAYPGAEGPILTPCTGKDKPESQKRANRAHARLRAPGERADARPKSGKVLRKPRCGPSETRPPLQGRRRPSKPPPRAGRMRLQRIQGGELALTDEFVILAVRTPG